MPDVKDLGNVNLETVNDNVRRTVQFAGSFDFLAGPAKAGEMLQVLNPAKNFSGDRTGGLGVVLYDVVNDTLKLGGSLGCPPDASHDSKSASMRLTTSS